MQLYFPQIQDRARGITRGITSEELDTVEGPHCGCAAAAVERARPGRADAALLVREMQWTLDVMALMTDDAHARSRAMTGSSDPYPNRNARPSRIDSTVSSIGTARCGSPATVPAGSTTASPGSRTCAPLISPASPIPRGAVGRRGSRLTSSTA